MNQPESHSTSDPFAFASVRNLPIVEDLNRNFDWHPRLTTSEEAINRSGLPVNYYFSQLDYVIGEDNVQASRMIAEIPPGNRTELAFWSTEAPEKQLDIHKGVGHLVLATLTDKGSYTWSIWELNSQKHSRNKIAQATLPPGSFYTIRVTQQSAEPLIVSGFYAPALTSWDAVETEVAANQKTITTPQGEITVPEELEILNRS